MAMHRTRALTIGEATCAGICSCGWVGPNRRDLGMAKVDANKHQVEAQRVTSQTDTLESLEDADVARQAARKRGR